MKPILAVCHTPSDNTQMLAEALLRGMQAGTERHDALVQLAPRDVEASHVLEAGGLIIGTTENFGSMAGLTKDFLERIYYPCLENTQGLPVGIYIRAGQDGRGTARQLETVITGLRWRMVQPMLTLRGPFDAEFIDRVEMLGCTLSAGLEAGIF
ncbi:MAG: flavodoxin family protein [Pseudomonadota bacterium]